ncbi:MAG TPA: tetratricopeptide repeat protein [Fibrobacteraceae bacterium]|nr:tetratricopeptide repeat protein [Fibrobacteraceae bacterium]
MPRAPFPTHWKNRVDARKVSFYALALILGGLITIGMYNLGRLLGPQRIEVGDIPFGLPPGSSLTIESGKEKKYPDPPVASLADLQRADELLRQGDWRQALVTYQAMQMQFPSYHRILVGLGKTLLAADAWNDDLATQWQSLLAQFDKLDPGDPDALWLRGMLAEKQGQSTVALQFLEEAVLKAPGHVEPHLSLARALFRGNQFLGAQTEARTGITLTHGSDGRFYAMLAWAYHGAGNLDSCGQVVEYGLSRFPGETALLTLEGYLKEYQGKFDQAEAHYRRALAINGQDSLAKEALASLGEKSPPGVRNVEGSVTPRSQAQVAIDILEPLVNLYPENMPLRDALGQAYLKARQFDLARDQFESIQDRDSEYPDIQLRIQEAKAVVREPASAALSQELRRTTDSLRSVKSEERTFSERLGHYLVRWGASPKEFFARYSVEDFKRIDSLVWQEKKWEPPFLYTSTIVFSKDRGLTAVHVTARDTSFHPGRPGTVFDLFGRLLAQNSRISGIGVSTGDSQCDTLSFQAVVWESPDNFEIMAQFSNRRYEVRLLRLDRSQFETMPRLCAHMASLKKY